MHMMAISWILAGIVLFVVIGCIEFGRRIGKRRQKDGNDPSKSGTGTVDAAVFGLLGLLIAFTFSGAATRFDVRRVQIVSEANALGTAYLRIDLLPPELQPAIRALFRDYTDSRLAIYRALPDLRAARLHQARSVELQKKLWDSSVAACAGAKSPAVTSLVVPALNEVFDIANSRFASAELHVPNIVIATLILMAAACALLAGFDMSLDKSRSWLHYMGFALVMAFVVFVILDLGFPRLGFLRVDSFDHFIVDARAAMN